MIAAWWADGVILAAQGRALRPLPDVPPTCRHVPPAPTSGDTSRTADVSVTCKNAPAATLTDQEIAQAELADWRKLAQGLHARYLIDDFASGARLRPPWVTPTGRSATT